MKLSDYLILLIIILVNVLVKLPGLGHSSFDLDEAAHLWYAQMPLSDVIARAAQDPNPPLFNILISFWIKAFGVDPVPARGFSLMFSALGAGALFLFLRRNFNMKMALIASALFVMAGIQLKFAHNARPYAMMVFLMVCSYGFMLEALKKPKPLQLFGYWLFTSLMLYAHPTTIFNLPAQALFILYWMRKDVRQMMLMGAPLVLSLGAYLAWHLSIPYFDKDQGTWLDPPTYDDALLAIRHLNTSWSNKIFYAQAALALLALGFVAVFRNRKGFEPILLGLLWAVVPFIGNIAYSHVSVPVFQYKYVLSAHVGMMVLMAASINALRWQVIQWPILGVFLWKMYIKMNWEITSGEDWNSAAKIVKADESKQTATFISLWYQHQSFAYSYNRDWYRDYENTQRHLYENRIFIDWNAIIPAGSDRPNYRRLHFIDTQPAISQQQNRLDSLRKHAQLVDEHQLEGMNIYTFDLKMPEPITHHVYGEEGELLEGDRIYSPEVLIPMDEKYGADTTVSISATVRGEQGLHDVFLVASFVRDEEYLNHQHIPVPEAVRSSTEEITISTTMHYQRDVHGASVLKTFVWNPSKRPLRVMEMKVTPVTP